MESPKSEKDIRSIIFASETKTVITYKTNFTPQNHNTAVKEVKTLKSNMARHDDFKNSMSPFKVHLMIRSQFAEPLDRMGCSIEAPFFTDHIFEDDDRFKGITVKGIIFTTKDDTTSFQIVGQKLTSDGQIIQLKSPVISTIKLAEGENVYNYPLLGFAKDHIDNLLLETIGFTQFKSNAMTLFNSATVTKLTPKQKLAAENNKAAEEGEGIAANG